VLSLLQKTPHYRGNPAETAATATLNAQLRVLVLVVVVVVVVVASYRILVQSSFRIYLNLREQFRI
jgi:hypothetical protein